MSGVDHGLVRESRQRLEALVHLLGIRSRQIGSSATVEEQRVARNQTSTGKKTLATRGVSRRVYERDVETTDGQRVARSVRNQMALVDLGCTNDPRNLVLVDMDRYVHRFEQVRNSVDAVAHH